MSIYEAICKCRILIYVLRARFRALSESEFNQILCDEMINDKIKLYAICLRYM